MDSRTTDRRTPRPADGADGADRTAAPTARAAHEPCLPGLDPTGAEDRPRALLFGSPREVLARISAGDPLGIRERVAACLGRERLLLDANRLHLRSLAHCAHRALRLRASEGLPGFLDGCVADAARELVREDRESARGTGGDGGAFAALGGPLGLDVALVRRACTSFNDCAYDDRRACLELLVEGRSIDELAKRDGVSVSEVARRARRALDGGLMQLRPANAVPEERRRTRKKGANR